MSDSDPRPGSRYEALLRLLRATEALWDTSRVFFERWDLSPSQFNLLKLLFDNAAGATQIELSRELIMHRSNVTGLVDRLEGRGLVKRRDVHSDRRAYRVVLTSAGRRLLLRILPVYYEAAEGLWAERSQREAEHLAGELESIVAQARRIVHAETNKSETKKGAT